MTVYKKVIRDEFIDVTQVEAPSDIAARFELDKYLVRIQLHRANETVIYEKL